MGVMKRFPVGSSTGTVNAAVGDDVYAGTAVNVSATIASASGGNYESLAVSAVPAVTVVSDDVYTTTESLRATANAAEGATITYSASVGAPVTGSDVTVTRCTGPLPTRRSSGLTGTVNAAVGDDVYAGTATNVSATISSASGGNYESLAVSAVPAVTVVTDDVDATTVSLSATANRSEERRVGKEGRVGSSVTESAVKVSLSNGQTMTMTVGSACGTVVVAVDDDVYAGTATNVSATISSASGGNYESLAVSAVPAVTVVTDDVDATTVSLSATAN